MKRFILAILTLVSSIFGALGEEGPSQDISQSIPASPQIATEIDKTAVKETLVNLEKQSWEAWKKRDGKFFEEFLSDDHVEVGFGGIATNAQVVAFVDSPRCEVKSYSIDRFELIMLEANTALLTYHAAQDTSCNRVAVPSPAWVSSLYIKRGGRWFNVLYQQTQTKT